MSPQNVQKNHSKTVTLSSRSEHEQSYVSSSMLITVKEIFEIMVKEIFEIMVKEIFEIMVKEIFEIMVK